MTATCHHCGITEPHARQPHETVCRCTFCGATWMAEDVNWCGHLRRYLTFRRHESGEFVHWCGECERSAVARRA